MDKTYLPMHIDILDSPCHHILLPFLEECSQSGYYDPRPRDHNTHNHNNKQEETRRSYKNINGIVSHELSQLTHKSEEEIEKYLYALDEILSLEKEVYQHMALENALFDETDPFEAFEEAEGPRSAHEVDLMSGSETDKMQIKIEEVSVEFSDTSVFFDGHVEKTVSTHIHEEQEILDTQSKIEVIRLKRLFNILRRKLRRFMEKKRKTEVVDRFHVCKFCGNAYDSGRELGGHMSRKHPGQSQIFRHKTKIHKIYQEERNRRKNFKLKPKCSSRKKGASSMEELLNGLLTVNISTPKKEQIQQVYYEYN